MSLLGKAFRIRRIVRHVRTVHSAVKFGAVMIAAHVINKALGPGKKDK